MISPIISYYARMEYCTEDGKKTPKYKVVKALGNYPPMETQRTKKGEICLYLMPTRGEKRDAPPMYLEFQNSHYNLSGLHPYFKDGRLNDFFWGYPLAKETYSNKQLPNPFYEYRNDGYLFIFHCSDRPTPDAIELIILENAKNLIKMFMEELIKGKLDAEVETLRAQMI